MGDGTAQELADLLGVSTKTVRELAGRDIITRVEKGRYDIAASVPRYCQHLRDLVTGKAGSEAAGAAAAAARRRLAEELDLHFKTQRVRGSLLWMQRASWRDGAAS